MIGAGEESNRVEPVPGGEGGFASSVQRRWFWDSAVSIGACLAAVLLRQSRRIHVK